MNTKNDTELSPEKLAELKKAALGRLSESRRSIMCRQAFISSILMRFEIIPVRDIRCRTACTDAKSIYFDIDFMSQLSDAELTFVLAHETWHNVMMHFARRQTRNADLFNIATDMEVNDLLAEQNDPMFKPPAGLLFPPPEVKGKSAEVIYDYLLKKHADNQKSSGKNGNESGKLTGQFDKHTYENDEEQSESGSEGSGVKDKWGNVGFDDDFKPSISADAAERIREASISAAQSYEKMHGKLPAGVDRIISKLAKPQVSWREKLCEFVTSVYGDTRRWLPPNRRYVHDDVYMQSHRGERINIAVAIDTSGSTQGDLAQFFGELKGLVDSFSMYTVHLIQCDAAVDAYDVYDENNPFDPDVNGGVEACGLGGTSFNPPFKYIKDNAIDVDCMVYFTDGYGPCTVKEPDFPVMWLISKDGTADFCSWGEKIFFKDSQF